MVKAQVRGQVAGVPLHELDVRFVLLHVADALVALGAVEDLAQELVLNFEAFRVVERCLLVLLNFALEGELVGDLVLRLEHGGHLDETRGVVEAEHVVEAASQLEGSAAHGATDVYCSQFVGFSILPKLRLLHYLLAQDGLDDWKLGELDSQTVDPLAKVKAAVHVDKRVGLVGVYPRLV